MMMLMEMMLASFGRHWASGHREINYQTEVVLVLSSPGTYKYRNANAPILQS